MINPNRNVLQFHLSGMLRAESRTTRNGNLNIKINKTPQKIRARTTSILHIFKKEKCTLGNKPITITVFRYS